ncbi:hypothetical protein HispidOSU_005010 [Sigmodon hispidus]
MASSSLLSNRLKASGKLELVNTMMDRLAISCTLRYQVFAVTTADTNPVDDITLLHLVSQPPHFIRLGGAWSPGGTANNRTLRRKRIMSDCFFLHSSWMYL